MILLPVVTTPTDPGGATGVADALYQNGPLGFLAAFAVATYLCLREFRRYREIDVQTYKSQIAELRVEIAERDERHRGELAQRDEEHRAEVASLKDDLRNVMAELAEMRDAQFEGGQEAVRRQAYLATENARYRLLLARHGIDPDVPAFQLPTDPPSIQ